MRYLLACVMTVMLIAGVLAAAQDKKPPDKLVIPSSKAGDVIFDHTAHVKREKADCATCHDKLWPQSAKVSIKSSSGCATCHKVDGRSFEMKGNCKKCHPSGGASTQS
jgi:c(7)-type cytochrome triheme protein